MADPVEIKFPINGINTAAGYIAQPDGTTPYAINVRPEDSLGGRIRGGSRGGVSKYNNTLLSATGIQCIQTVPVARDLRSVDIDTLVYEDDFEDYTIGTRLEVASSGVWSDRYNGGSGSNPLRTASSTLGPLIGSVAVPSGNDTNVYSSTAGAKSSLLQGVSSPSLYVIKTTITRPDSIGGYIYDAGIAFRVNGTTSMSGYILTIGSALSTVNGYRISLYSCTSTTATQVFLSDDFVLPNSGTWGAGPYNTHVFELRVNGSYCEVYMDSAFVTSFTISLYSASGFIGFVTGSTSGATKSITDFKYYTAKSSANPSDTKTIAISGGNLYDVTTTASTLISSSVATSGERIHTQGAFQKFYIAGNTSGAYKIYDPLTQVVSTWTPTSGSLPTDAYSYGCPYITLYRGRIVLWGLNSSPQNWYMSKAGDPLDWSYSPDVTTEIQAIAGNNSTAGLLGDALMACIPYSDDLMLMGGDHTMWVMRGDPAAGGVIDLISEKTGIRSPDAFCIDPGGTIYFVGTDGVYAFNSDSITSITDTTLRGVFEAIDYTKYWPIMEWSYFERGCYVSLVPIDASTDDYITYFYHPETKSWWKDIYPDNIGPYVLKAVDGNKPNDTVLLIGSPDGYIRYINDSATTDDGTAITSELDLKAIYGNASQDVKITGIRAITDTGSSSLTAKIYKGNTPQQAYASTTVALAKTLVAGRSTPIMQKIAAPALRIRLSATGRWGMEQLMVEVDSGGKNKVHRG